MFRRLFYDQWNDNGNQFVDVSIIQIHCIHTCLYGD